jgi:hypothetical protein
MSGELALALMVAFCVKHYVWDFTRLQTPRMFLNKGTYGHPGGIAHTWVHALTSFLILMLLVPGHHHFFAALGLSALEFFVHYHMDWFKMWWNKRNGYKPDTHFEFWNLVGVDQLVHYLTYITMTWMYLS